MLVALSLLVIIDLLIHYGCQATITPLIYTPNVQYGNYTVVQNANSATLSVTHNSQLVQTFTVSFSNSFISIPTMAAWITTINDQQSNNPPPGTVYYSRFFLYTEQITLTNFVLKVEINDKVNIQSLAAMWIASTNSKYFVTTVTCSPNAPLTYNFPTVYSTLPTGFFFLKGVKQQRQSQFSITLSVSQVVINPTLYNDLSESFHHAWVIIDVAQFGQSAILTEKYDSSMVVDGVYSPSFTNKVNNCIMPYYGMNGYQAVSTANPYFNNYIGNNSANCQTVSFRQGFVAPSTLYQKAQFIAGTVVQIDCPASSVLSLASKFCTCDTGYFDDSTICSACSKQCKTCTAYTTCTTCPTGVHRKQSGSSCPCDDLYYDDGVNAACLTCDYTCATCKTSSTTCLTCPAGSKRVLSSTTCPCSAGFYNISPNVICGTCIYSCATCTNGSNCATCSSSAHRTKTGSNQCDCDNTYFDDGTSNQQCATCSYPCGNCQTTATKCLSCYDLTNRTYTSGTFSCKCNTGYYDDIGTKSCQKCHYTCDTCTTYVACATCPTSTFRTINNTLNTCPCDDQYYDDGAVALCLKCSYKCLTCKLSGCLTCPNNSKRTKNNTDNTCPCDSGYYDNSVATCAQCHYSCKVCSAFSVCSDCNSVNHRALSGSTCPCSKGYFDNTTNGMCGCSISNAILACNPKCTACTSLPICTECSAAAFRTLSAPSCICMDGYFDDGVNSQCARKNVQQPKECVYPCVKCVDNSSKCLSCVAENSRTFSAGSNSCPCNDGQKAQYFITQGKDYYQSMSDEEENKTLSFIQNTLDKLFTKQQKTILSIVKYGICSNLQEIKDGNIVLADKLGQVLSSMILKNSNNSQALFSQQSILQSVQIQQQIYLEGTLPNQGLQFTSSKGYKFVTSFVTGQGLLQATQQPFTYRAKLPDAGSLMKLEKDTSEKALQMETKYYSFKISQFTNNLKRTQKKFPYKDQNSQLINFGIKQQRSDIFDSSQDVKGKDIKIFDTVKIGFQSVKSSKRPSKSKTSNQTCISESVGDWTNTNCLTTSTNKSTVNCGCDELSFYAVVDDVEGLFTESKDVLNMDAFNAALNFEWQKCYLFYLFLMLSLSVFAVAIWGWRKDISEAMQVVPVNGKIFQQVNQENTYFKNQQDEVVAEKENSIVEFHSFASVHSQKKGNINKSPAQQLKTPNARLNENLNGSPDKLENVSLRSKEPAEPQPYERTKQNFWHYSLFFHPITNIVMEFCQELSRPLRAGLLYNGILIGLGTTVYFGDDLSLIRLLTICAISSILGLFHQIIFQKLFSSDKNVLKVFGVFLYICSNGFIIFIIMAVVATTSTFDQTNIWTLQYLLQLTIDNSVFQMISLLVKYKIEKELFDGSVACCLSVLQKMCLR